MQPTWLQYHGPSLHDREFKLKGRYAYGRHRHHHNNLFYLLHPHHRLRRRRSSTRSLCPSTTSSDRTRQSADSADQLSADDLQSRTRTQKRARALKGAVSSAAEHYSRRPFTVFTPKRSTRATRSRTTRCKHYCHAFLHHGRKCLCPSFIADVHFINGSKEVPQNLLSENMVRFACCLCLGCLVLRCAISMFVLSQTSLSHSGVFGCYAQFDIWKREMGLPALL